ncbi:TonB family protein [Piscinibacter sp. Jin2]|uniref:TonB family protein n=1 Tax=Aquariibacter lacus TaxID=2801332 RepID=A0A9X0XAZ5_9BURK|nr:TonB family protein [Piscinibacter lacus]MBL0718692.1 TonB family protein [Piscinibacter lacus]
MSAALAPAPFTAPLSRPAVSGLTLAVLLAHGLLGMGLLLGLNAPEAPPLRPVVEAVLLAPPAVPAAPARALPPPPRPAPRPVARPLPRPPVPLATPQPAPLPEQDSVPPLPVAEPLAEPAPRLPTEAATAVATRSDPGPAEAPPRPAPPPAPAQDPAPLPPGALRYRQAPAPSYPLLSRRQQEAGTVMLRILVDALGRPREWRIETSSGHPRLDAAALAAAAQTLFEPPPQAPARGVWVLAPINFVLGR